MPSSMIILAFNHMTFDATRPTSWVQEGGVGWIFICWFFDVDNDLLAW